MQRIRPVCHRPLPGQGLKLHRASGRTERHSYKAELKCAIDPQITVSFSMIVLLDCLQRKGCENKRGVYLRKGAGPEAVTAQNPGRRILAEGNYNSYTI